MLFMNRSLYNAISVLSLDSVRNCSVVSHKAWVATGLILPYAHVNALSGLNGHNGSVSRGEAGVNGGDQVHERVEVSGQ